jgi:hypothetical protein
MCSITYLPSTWPQLYAIKKPFYLSKQEHPVLLQLRVLLLCLLPSAVPLFSLHFSRQRIFNFFYRVFMKSFIHNLAEVSELCNDEWFMFMCMFMLNLVWFHACAYKINTYKTKLVTYISYNNNNNNNNLLTASGLSPGGSGYFTFKLRQTY